MTKLLLLSFLTLFSNLALSSEHQMIDTLGASPKGQYVALEEYGYTSLTHSYYVRIKVMNVWKKEYVGKEIEVKLPAHRPDYLDKARSEARTLAKDELKRFEISG